MTEKLSAPWSTLWLRVNKYQHNHRFECMFVIKVMIISIYFSPSCLGLCPDWSDWKSNNALQNAKEAMGLADDWLNVKQVIIIILNLHSIIIMILQELKPVNTCMVYLYNILRVGLRLFPPYENIIFFCLFVVASRIQ